MALEGPRAARADELDAVVALADTVFGEGRPHDMGRWFPKLFGRGNLEHLRVFVDDGRPVALAGFTLERIVVPGAAFAAALVGSVCTLPSHQGRGLGTRLMDDCTATALADGASVLLISGGRGLYRRMGAIDAGRYVTVRVPRDALADAARTCRAARDWRIADVPRMTELYRAEPVRFERPEGEFLAFLRTGMAMARPCRTWVVPSAADPAVIDAYLVVLLPRSTPGGRVVSVREMAGSRRAALEALPAVMEAMGADQAEADCLGCDREMARLAAARGLETVPRGFPGTVKVIDPPMLLPVLRTCAGPGVAVSATVDSLAFRLGAESFVVSGAEDITAFAFGSIERPLDVPGHGPLRTALQAGFPVLLPDYGLNYI